MSDQEDEGRPRREATKVKDFKQFHRTGKANEDKGRVAEAVEKLETPDKKANNPDPKK